MTYKLLWLLSEFIFRNLFLDYFITFNISKKNKLSEFPGGFVKHVINDTVAAAALNPDQLQIFSLCDLDHLKTKNQNFALPQTTSDSWLFGDPIESLKKARIKVACKKKKKNGKILTSCPLSVRIGRGIGTNGIPIPPKRPI